MSKFLIAALALSTAVVAAPAMAQDAPQAFSGARVEVLGGWDRDQLSGVGHDDGVLYGVGAGYDFRRGNTVFGVEGEATDSTQKITGLEHASRDLAIGGRVGVVVGGSNLLYAKAAYTNARYSVAGAGTNLDGVRVGAGIEHQLGSRAFVKAEYRYSNYEQGASRNQVLAGVGFRF